MIVAEADTDRLVLAPLLLVHQLGKHLQVGFGRLAAQGQRAGKVAKIGPHCAQLAREIFFLQVC